MQGPALNVDILAFAAACEAATSLEELETLWRRRLRELGFTFVALGVHADPLDAQANSYVFQNYPKDWIAHFSSQRYHLIDPVFRTVEAGVREFLWTDPAFLGALSWRQRRILNEASEIGLRHGRTHTLASFSAPRASGSFVAANPDMPEPVYALAKLINTIVHHRATQMCAGSTQTSVELRRRERQCLELCASGMTDAEVARRLSIGVATVRRHIERARVRLGASTRTQAAVRAISSGQIKPIV